MKPRLALALLALACTIVAPPAWTQSALDLIREAAEAGDSQAQARLGYMYAEGDGAPRDPDQAERWYRLAAAQGEVSARFNLALLLLAQHRKDEAAGWLAQAAENGFPPAMVQLAELHDSGRGVPRDPAQATAWLGRAAALGDAAAMNNLALRLARGEGTAADAPAALAWLERAAATGHLEAMANLGLVLAQGMSGLPARPEAALPWLERAAEAGHTGARYQLGLMAEQGSGMPTDLARAARFYDAASETGDVAASMRLAWLIETGALDRPATDAISLYERAFARGEARAATALGRILREGRHVTQDFAAARSWFERAAQAGDPHADYALGLMAELGQGMDKSSTAAVAHYLAAAEKGHPAAQGRLGLLYHRQGRPREALDWLTRAAESGDATAANNLGVLYEEGQAGVKDEALAARWYRLAAEAGDRIAANNLGVLYRDGRGVPRNLDEARRWFQRSADAGYPRAKLNLGLLIEAEARSRSSTNAAQPPQPRP